MSRARLWLCKANGVVFSSDELRHIPLKQRHKDYRLVSNRYVFSCILDDFFSFANPEISDFTDKAKERLQELVDVNFKERGQHD